MDTPFIKMSSSIKTVLPDEEDSLERAWERRRQELGNWQPSNGWLMQKQAPAVRPPKVASARRK